MITYKKWSADRYVIEQNGIYFTLTWGQLIELRKLVEEIISHENGSSL